jgi:hypothetical protein
MLASSMSHAAGEVSLKLPFGLETVIAALLAGELRKEGQMVNVALPEPSEFASSKILYS